MKFLQSKHFFIQIAYICIDVFFVVLAIVMATWFRIDNLPPIFDQEYSVQFILFGMENPFHIIFSLWCFIFPAINFSHKLYQTRREIRPSIEILEVVKSTLITGLVIMVLIYLLKVEQLPRSVFGLIVVITCLFSMIWRMLKRWFVEYIVARGYNNFNVLIIGGGKVGVELARAIQSKPGYGLNIVGFLDDYKTNEDMPDEFKIAGKLSDFSQIAQKNFITKIFITIHHDSEVFYKLLSEAKDLGVAVRVVPPAFDLISGEIFRYNIGLIPILEYSNVGVYRTQTGKRLFDFVSSLLGFIMLLPVFIVIGIMIKLDSRGPVFYCANRYGRDGKDFNMIKFRSMVVGAEDELDSLKSQNEVDGPIFKIKKDPRVTKLGLQLRKYSLDELPQIINVIKGEMSLVGPRPLPKEQIEQEDLRQLKRLGVRPGITGLWQVRGRSDLPFKRLVKWDVWYIRNWSFGLDMSILLQTFPVVFKGKGAY